MTAVHDSRIVEIEHFKGKGRPPKGSTPDFIRYHIDAGIASVPETLQRMLTLDVGHKQHAQPT